MQAPCFALTGKPCRCNRVSVSCYGCGEKFTVTAGENATPRLSKDSAYQCIRCRARR